ncbi:hypothetical protein [Lactiplantibacillus xiangfangensis]|nr:hypothetical protein [Lactiplantibacillus xiangfangensis]
MQKPITELAKLKDINEACSYATKGISLIRKSYSSILAISDLVTPTLKQAVNSHDNYFKMSHKELRQAIDERETTLYSTICILRELGELAMNIDQDTADVEGTIGEINDIATGVNAGINQVLNRNNGVSDSINPVSNDENSKGAADHE